MTSPTTRVRALLARAVDPGSTPEEQRTSALIAARLIKKHGLTVVGKEAERAPPRVEPREQQRPPADDFGDFFRRAARAYARQHVDDFTRSVADQVSREGGATSATYTWPFGTEAGTERAHRRYEAQQQRAREQADVEEAERQARSVRPAATAGHTIHDPDLGYPPRPSEPFRARDWKP